MTSLDKKIKKVKLKLFSNQFFFFGIQLYKFKWVFINGDDSTIAYVQFNAEEENYYGSIFLNRNFIDRPEFTSDHLIRILIHEFLHILHGHGERSTLLKEHYQLLWNIACDHVIERELKLTKAIQSHDGNWNIVNKLDNELPNCTTEEAYEWLQKNIPTVKIKQMFDKSGNQTGDYNQATTLIVEIDEKDGNGPKDFTVTKPANNSKQEKEQTRQFINESIAVKETLKQKGNLSGRLGELIDKLLKVKIDTNKLLEKAIKNFIQYKPSERSWRKPNKYFIPHNIYLPGLTSEEDNRFGTLIVALDSSGSMSTKDLQHLLYVIYNTFNYFNRIYFIVHDVEINQIEIFNKEDKEKFREYIKNTGIKGRGGTSHEYVFKEIQKIYELEPDELSLCIFFTDNYSDIEHIYPKYDWFIKDTIPTVMVVNKDRYAPFSNKTLQERITIIEASPE